MDEIRFATTVLYCDIDERALHSHSTMRAQTYYRGKVVALVCPAPLVDSPDFCGVDTIVHVNKASVIGDRYGDRTDVSYQYFRLLKDTRLAHIHRERRPFVVNTSYRQKYGEEPAQRVDDFYASLGCETERLPEKIIPRLCRDIGSYPTAGLIALAHIMLHKPKQVRLVGFSLRLDLGKGIYQNEYFCYDENAETIAQREAAGKTHHSILKELAFFKRTYFEHPIIVVESTMRKRLRSFQFDMSAGVYINGLSI